ncbi:MAG: DinB family protein [Chloroflexi bacterium]|nr:DinB family protein [Chloroflexota bacterium]MDA1240914.1 DinB family protein [Chloroflexota bacterium]
MTSLDGRRYLLGQAERYDWVELWPRVVGTRTALIEELGGLSEEQALWKPPPGLIAGEEDGWSIAQVARHVLGWSAYALGIIEATGNGRTADATLPPRPLPEGAPLAEMRRGIIEISERIASVRSRMPDSPDDAATVSHERFGELPSRAWYAFVRLHDLDHIGQIKGIKASEGFPA